MIYIAIVGDKILKSMFMNFVHACMPMQLSQCYRRILSPVSNYTSQYDETQFTTVNGVTLQTLTVELKLKVVRLHREGFRVRDILKNLNKENGVSIGRRHVAKFLRTYERTGELCYS